jgi:hypothetical protein
MVLKPVIHEISFLGERTSGFDGQYYVSERL